ncbi:hypothetical protein PRK78_003375 [Emydomyces testavorans]|uniref:Uncharacterized protein n=1 Tax=Emydomyces testavorans TaxID=2070801 RepID=A0AAF0DGQ2_9EURO|nr:hypothetical protein PRK78_003375 [Emydomyces testavorans]
MSRYPFVYPVRENFYPLPYEKDYSGSVRHRPHRSPNPAITSARKERRQSINQDFSKALEQLIHTLREAADFFTCFEKSFANDTSLIKSYAPQAVLEKLWASKALSADTAIGECPSSSQDGSDTSKGSFSEHFARIQHDFDAVLELAPVAPLMKSGRERDRERKAEAESTDRLLEILSRQYEAIWRMAGKLRKDSLYVKEFVKEAELLLSYLEKSKYLWKEGLSGVKDGT